MAKINDKNSLGVWWSEVYLDDSIGRATALNANYDTLRTAQNTRISNSVKFDSLYDGMDYAGTLAAQDLFARRPKMPPISFNALRIVGDTLISKLVQAETKVTFLTDGGDWGERKKAELLDKFIFGEFYRTDLYEKATTARTDAIRHGNGYLKFSIGPDGKVWVQRVHPAEILFDEVETFVGPPRTMYQESLVAPDTLLAMYTDKEQQEAINNASTVVDSQYHYFTQHVGDVKRVVEAWRLPSIPGAGDGRHVICTDAGVLIDEPWDRDSFPFAVFRLYPRARGAYAIGLVERQLELQLSLNKLLRRIHACIHLLAAPYFLVERGSQVTKAHFNQDIGNFIEYLGKEPILQVNNVVPAELVNEVQRLLSWMLMDAGVNELEVAGTKPEGLDSGPAFERYTDRAAVRHTTVLKENERFFMQCAECIMEEIRTQPGGGVDYKAFAHFDKHAEVIDWADIDLDKQAYVMKMAAMNLLPTEPAGRANEVIRLTNAGILTPTQSVRALKSPDIEAISSDITAPDDDIEWTIYQMTKAKGARYLPPEPFQDLEGGITKVQHAYLRERDANAPESILSNLRMWITKADSMLEEQRQALAQEQMMAQSQLAMAQQAMAGATGAAGGAPGADQAGAPAPEQPIGQTTPNPLTPQS